MLPSTRLASRLVLATAIVCSLAAGARAEEQHCRVPMADWQPREAVKAMAEARGLTVRRIKIDDGCYEVDARDAQGRRVELRLDPATLDLLALDDEHEEDDDN